MGNVHLASTELHSESDRSIGCLQGCQRDAPGTGSWFSDDSRCCELHRHVVVPAVEVPVFRPNRPAGKPMLVRTTIPCWFYLTSFDAIRAAETWNAGMDCRVRDHWGGEALWYLVLNTTNSTQGALRNAPTTTVFLADSLMSRRVVAASLGQVKGHCSRRRRLGPSTCTPWRPEVAA